jgi:hypothetical protein
MRSWTITLNGGNLNSIIHAALALCLTALFSGCAITPIPIDNLTYSGTMTVKSNKTASIRMESSGVGSRTDTYMMPVGGIQIPVTRKSAGMPFGVKDQLAFQQSLQKELVRLGVVKIIKAAPGDPADININVRIDSASLHGDLVEYAVEMTLTLSSEGATSVQRHYSVVSSEKDTLWERMNTNGAQAREKVAQLMLDRLIPAIEAYVHDVAKPSQAAVGLK